MGTVRADEAAPLLTEAEALFADLRANRWVGDVRSVSAPLVP